LRVHHTSNVKVEAKANTKRFVLESTVLVLEENVVGPVGALGDPLPPRAKFSLLSKPPSAAPGFLYMIASMALAFVPVYGWIASLALTVGELVYTYKTGEDF